MSDFLHKVGKILYPQASDQEIMQAINQIKQTHPKETDENIVLSVLVDFVQSKRGK